MSSNQDFTVAEMMSGGLAAGATPAPVVKARAGAKPTASAAARAEAAANTHPQWKDQTLSFAGWFTQRSAKGPIYRKANLKVFLEDETLEITEPRNMPHVPGGHLLRRSRAVRRDEEGNADGYVTWVDLHQGQDVAVQGQVYNLSKADRASAQWLGRQAGYHLGQETEIPAECEPPPPELPTHGHAKNDPVRDLILMNNGIYKKTVEDVRGFQEMSGKVLCFMMQWQDPGSMMRRTFRLKYYLVDCTVEIDETPGSKALQASPFGTLIKRAPMPASFSWQAQDLRPALPDETNEDTIRPEDLSVGGSINVYGRQCTFFDADPFTRRWYRDSLSTELAPKCGEAVAEQFAIPLSYSDPAAFAATQDKVDPASPMPWTASKSEAELRYEMKMVTSHKVNKLRSFVLTYYVKDNSLNIIELPTEGVTETGRSTSGAMFLYRGQCPREEHGLATTVNGPVDNDGNIFLAPDMYIGAKVAVHARTFEIVGADVFTHSFMQKYCEQWPFSDSTRVLADLKAQVAARGSGYLDDVIAAMEALDDSNDGLLSSDEFLQALGFFGFRLQQAELETLARRFVDENRNINYAKMALELE